jgi:DNA-binding GntR family transcriptional regulator/AraC-like DNA-binding protein
MCSINGQTCRFNIFNYSNLEMEREMDKIPTGLSPRISLKVVSVRAADNLTSSAAGAVQVQETQTFPPATVAIGNFLTEVSSLYHHDSMSQLAIGAPQQLALGRTRLARELYGGRFRPTETVKLREVAAEYDLDLRTVLRAFSEFQALGMVTLSNDVSAVVHSPNLEEMQQAFEVRSSIEEIAGRIAATVLKGYTAELNHHLDGMRVAAAARDFDRCADHDVEFHRTIIKASQNDVLLRTWDMLAVDLRMRAIGKISGDFPEVVESHQLILNALETGRGTEAGLLLRSHVQISLRYLARNQSSCVARVQREDRRPLPTSYRGGLGGARLRRVIELVHARIEEDLSIEEMATCAGLSTAHFSRMFHESTQESPHQFVLRTRIERAKEMLRSPDGRILDVAIASGFKTQQHFARVFRRICGMTPSRYRREFL